MERAGRSGERERQRVGGERKRQHLFRRLGVGWGSEKERERAHTSWRRQKQGVGGACLLIGQDTQVKGQQIIHQ